MSNLQPTKFFKEFLSDGKYEIEILINSNLGTICENNIDLLESTDWMLIFFGLQLDFNIKFYER